MGLRRLETAWRAAAWVGVFSAGSAWGCGRSIRHDEVARGGSSAWGAGGVAAGTGAAPANAGGDAPSSAGQGTLERAGSGGVDGIDGTGGETDCIRVGLPIRGDYPTLYFMIDRSPLMGDPGDQEHNGFFFLSRALAQFTDEYATNGQHGALGYFPSGGDEEAMCSAKTYARPEIDEVSIRGAAQDFEASLEAQTFGEDLHPAAALEGAIAWARDFSGESGDEAAVVFVTAGLPTTCPGGTESDAALDGLVAAAKEGQSPADDRAERVKSYVIAVADPADDELLGALDRVAAAGGTERALVASEQKPLT
ncbi:MAG TPA: hypothetical protein VGQ57_19850, partial [Polyangiaceae bacterium]|nr:hypothetical protein [Polyangiaceae bacterium]